MARTPDDVDQHEPTRDERATPPATHAVPEGTRGRDASPGGSGQQAEGELEELAGEYDIRAQPATKLAKPAVATIWAQVVRQRGARLPGWYERGFYPAFEIAIQNQNGGEAFYRLHYTAKAQVLLYGTGQVRCRFVFYQRSFTDSLNDAETAVARSPWHVIQEIQKGMQYTVRFRLGEEGLEKLRAISRAEARP
ncbi:MAG TPA: hypothetical protein EYP56_12475 [Planctomycetaceae bacterium]|nr:hypothetical protein [Planctomycetaceae bacterium]